MYGLISATETPIPLKGISVKVCIVGTVAEVESRLTYKNEEDDPIEATFIFPVDDGSAVYRFEADIQGRRFVAEIQEKDQAMQTYEDSMAAGRTAALLKQDDESADIFQCMLGNLPPQAEAALRLVYVIELPQEADGALRFTLPTILNPRYSPDVGRTVSAENASYVPPCQNPYDFAFEAKVKGYHKVSSVRADDGTQLKVEMEENNSVAKVSLAEKFKFDRDLSFVVNYENCFNPQVIMETGKPEEAGVFKEDMLMLSFRPDLKEVSIVNSGEYIFVIDRSGSMRGDKIVNAKEALLLFLKSLPVDCYFNVVSFGSNFEILFPSCSKKYCEATLNDALRLQESMDADMGWTAIFDPLEHILTQRAIEGHQKNIFVLTDGQVGKTDKVIALVRNHAATTRVFALGIGHGASTALVNGIARAGTGKSAFIVDNSNIKPKVISLLNCSMQPACTNIEVSWDLPRGVTPMLIPQDTPPIVAAGERMTLYALMQGTDCNMSNGQSSVTVRGQLHDQVVCYTLPFTLNEENTSLVSSLMTSPVHRLASKAQIKLLEDEEAAMMSHYNRNLTDATKLREKIIILSRHANVVSKFTSFVAVDKDGEEVQGPMVQRNCPIPASPSRHMQDQGGDRTRQSPYLQEVDTYYVSQPQTERPHPISKSRDGPTFPSSGLIERLSSPFLPTLSRPTPPSDMKAVVPSPSFPPRSKPVFDRNEKLSSSLFPPRPKHKFDTNAESDTKTMAPPRSLPSINEPESDTQLMGPLRANRLFFKSSFDTKAATHSRSVPPLEKSSLDTKAATHSRSVPPLELSYKPGRCTDVFDTKAATHSRSVPPLEKSSVSYKPVRCTDVSGMKTDLSSPWFSSFSKPVVLNPERQQMLDVIAQQKHQGNWELTDTLTTLLKLSKNQIRSAVAVKNDSVACTVVVVAWIRKKFAYERKMLMLIETKALAWLKSQSLGDKTVSDLLKECAEYLWP